ncbi:universal stress protein [Aestuariivita sp.]|jgi:nucleotide-binding universal stress UspA family protein|uniref:universal stress protein n=1 Tax=Aestuariivita sp. TaxID=1872407 RepID=UPI00216B9703|nr:universal stress protein [Aestuariivita sp.]MCE8006436.1 universal stress protein [Aestuariivita sp.]
MQRFKKILVVVDEASVSDAVFERATWLAQANAAELTLVDIIDGEPGELSRLFAALPGRRATEVEEQVIAFHRTRVEDLAQPLREKGIAVETEVLNGASFIQIIRRVLRHGHDLVLKGAHRGPDRPFLRAPDLHLLRKAPCPVWILNGETRAKSERIMAAVDPDPEDTVRDALNRMVMELATSLAQQDAAKLDVMNAWHVQEESTLRHGLVKMPEDEIQAILSNEERKSTQRLDQLMSGFIEFSDLMRVLHIKGIAADVIPEHVDSEGIDTLVMGTLGRTGISGFFIGNTAETILNRVSCSVLAIKPMGFVSPVRLEDED